MPLVCILRQNPGVGVHLPFMTLNQPVDQNIHFTVPPEEMGNLVYNHDNEFSNREGDYCLWLSKRGLESMWLGVYLQN